jgi:hypothetical protein
VGVAPPPLIWGQKQIQFPKHCVFLYLELWTMDKVQTLSDSDCYTPSSESFRFFLKVKFFKCLIKYHAMVGVCRYRSMPCNLSTIWESAVSCTSQPFYSQGRAPPVKVSLSSCYFDLRHNSWLPDSLRMDGPNIVIRLL